MRKASTKGDRRAARAAGAPSNNGWAYSSLAKSTTGMSGLDEITSGCLPQGRPTLVCGAAGYGKTLFASLSNTAILRTELRRLFRWLKDTDLQHKVGSERIVSGIPALDEMLGGQGFHLSNAGVTEDVTAMLVRLVDFLKSQQIASRFTSLTTAGTAIETTESWTASARCWRPGSRPCERSSKPKTSCGWPSGRQR